MNWVYQHPRGRLPPRRVKKRSIFAIDRAGGAVFIPLLSCSRAGATRHPGRICPVPYRRWSDRSAGRWPQVPALPQPESPRTRKSATHMLIIRIRAARRVRNPSKRRTEHPNSRAYAQQQGQKIADSQRILERRPVSADKHAQFGNAMHKHHDCYAQAQQQNAEVHTGVGGQGGQAGGMRMICFLFCSMHCRPFWRQKCSIKTG